MKKFLKVILSILGCISGCAILVFLMWLFWESPNPPEDPTSEYDTQYVGTDNFVVLSSVNVQDLQTEVLEYICSLKEVEKLNDVEVRLNKDLDIIGCTFSYTLDDIEGYYGIFEVTCSKEENWIMKGAEVSYHEGVLPPSQGTYSDNADAKLQEKIEEMLLFIKQNAWYEFDVYAIEIFNEYINLRGVEQLELGRMPQKYWRVRFDVSEYGMVLVDEACNGKDEIEEKICLEIKDGMLIEQHKADIDEFGEEHGSMRICMPYDLEQINEMVAVQYGENYINTEYVNLYKYEDSELWSGMQKQDINAYYFKLVSGKKAKTICVEVYVVSDEHDSNYLYIFY